MMAKLVELGRLAMISSAAVALAICTANAADLAKVQVGESKVFPESMTATSDGTLYASTFTQGVIFKAAPGAEKADVWVERQPDGPQAVVGVFADEAQGTLWACYSDPTNFSGGENSQPAIVRSVDLASGQIKASYPFPDRSFCNDFATTADGTVYVADTAGGRIMRLLPGGSALEEWLKDDLLAGVDGLSFSADGTLYANSVTTNKLFRIDMGADGSAGKVTELQVSQPLKGPDGMRFGDDGVLYLAENGAGQVDAITIEGDDATVKVIKGGYDSPTAVSKVGDTLWVLEAKLGKMGEEQDPGPFYMYPVSLTATP
jgi:sugar lactone lactonase YvrE